ncbi:hypothetical protein TNCT_144531 [Trichonephila clavata]|uniref:Uncharacterized protein n=1 Tax=Trichonephila clavata TaxID=2740835 RepID=A0A8X6GZC3_TRICU|nr:hypothetical protein TNCT_144531 [Trichonephila clavata]
MSPLKERRRPGNNNLRMSSERREASEVGDRRKNDMKYIADYIEIMKSHDARAISNYIIRRRIRDALFLTKSLLCRFRQ